MFEPVNEARSQDSENQSCLKIHVAIRNILFTKIDSILYHPS